MRNGVTIKTFMRPLVPRSDSRTNPQGLLDGRDPIEGRPRFQGLSPMERAGFEPATSGLQSRERGDDERRRATTNASSHAGLRGIRASRARMAPRTGSRTFGPGLGQSRAPLARVRMKDERLARAAQPSGWAVLLPRTFPFGYVPSGRCRESPVSGPGAEDGLTRALERLDSSCGADQRPSAGIPARLWDCQPGSERP